MFVNKFLHISRAHISESKRFFIVKSPLYYFHMKTKILADFEICISVPLRQSISRINNKTQEHQVFIQSPKPTKKKSLEDQWLV